MSNIKTMNNGNIFYTVNEKNFTTITLLFDVKSVTYNGKKFTPGTTIEETMEMDIQISRFIKGGDENIEILMKELTNASYEWINKHGLSGTVMNHTIVKPNEWIDFHILSTELLFDKALMSNNNFAKIKDGKMYEKLSSAHGVGNISVEVDLVLS